MTDTIRDLKRLKELVAQMTTDFLATTADLADSLNCMNAWYIENSGNGVPELEALLRRCLAALAAEPAPVAVPGEQYHEDMGPVTWWRLPVDEPPWVGTPNDWDWPGYHTHFTPAPPVPVNAHPLPRPEAGE